MAKAKGGWGKIVFNMSDTPSGGTEITLLAQENTNFVPETPMEALANGKEAGAGKKLAGTIRSFDINGAWVSTLATAEDALTPLFFFFYHLNGTDYYSLKSTLVVVEHKPADAGKHHAVEVKLSGYAKTQADLVGLTMA